MSKTPKRHRARKLLLIAALIGIVIAVRQAVADKGGSYDPPDPPR